MAQITYSNKVALNVNPNIDDINKVTDADMNEIKDVVNENYAEQSRMITNGTGYVKMSDGTLICYGKLAAVDVTAGTTNTRYITLPQEYVDTNFVCTCSINDSSAYWANGLAIRGRSDTTTTIKIDIGNYLAGNTATNIQVGYITIGKWK